MNAKLCKRLRRVAKLDTSYQQKTVYKQREHFKKEFILNKEGLKQLITVKKIQVLVGKCQRMVYLQLKKHYNKEHGVTTYG